MPAPSSAVASDQVRQAGEPGCTGYEMRAWPWLVVKWPSASVTCARVMLQVMLAINLACTARAQSDADAKPLPTAVLIFDGSGSMWAKMDGEKQIKLALARDSVKQALAKIAPQSTQLGLMSFGHRRQGDCSDVQVIAAPELTPAPGFVDRILTPLEKLNPKGKGPLTAALREAARLLGKSAGPRSIVLIHDDPDNCQQDTCTALAELQQLAPGVIVHVVGLGLKPDDAKRYQCLTKPTGGKHIDAQDGTEIAAGIGEVMQLATLGVTEAVGLSNKPAPAALVPVPAPALPPVVVAPVAPAVDLLRDGPPALRLRGLLSRDRLVTASRIRWTVQVSGAAGGATPAMEAWGNDIVLPAEPGTYSVRAVAGLVQGVSEVTVGAKGQAMAEVIFEAAEIRIKSPLPGDATVVIAERDVISERDMATAAKAAKTAAKGLPAVGRALGVWPHGQTSMVVPARALVLTLEQSELHTSWPVDMAAGQVREIDVGQAGGRVSLDLMAAAGPAVPATALSNQPVVFTVEDDDPDAPRGRREIARSASAAAEFVVAPGSYMISASRGPLETRERITVSAGEEVHRSLPLLAARVVFGARLGKQTAAAGERPSDSFRLIRLDDDRGVAVMLPGPAAIADVPPGRYRVEARRNNAAIKAEQEFDVKAGDYRAVTLEYQAGELRFNGTIPADGAEALGWRILDARGRLVDSGDETSGARVLAAGRYILRIDAGGKLREEVVEVRAGEVVSVRLR